MWLQVFFQSETRVDMETFIDATHHAGELMMRPFAMRLVRARLSSEAPRFEGNWGKLRSTWELSLIHI